MSNPTPTSALSWPSRSGARPARVGERLGRAERANGDRDQRLLAEARARRLASVCRPRSSAPRGRVRRGR